jgi:cell division protease FtsH
VFLGRDVTTHRNLSNATAEKVDREVTRIIEEQYNRARRIIEENRDRIVTMARALIEWETLEASQIEEIMAGKEPTPPSDLGSSSGDSDKPKSPTPKPDIKPNMDSPAGSSA